MVNTSSADLSLPERVAALTLLTSLSQRFGPVMPVYGVISLDGSWRCECVPLPASTESANNPTSDPGNGARKLCALAALPRAPKFPKLLRPFRPHRRRIDDRPLAPS